MYKDPLQGYKYLMMLIFFKIDQYFTVKDLFKVYRHRINCGLCTKYLHSSGSTPAYSCLVPRFDKTPTKM